MHETPYENAPSWFSQWESIGLVAWKDKNNDGVMQYGVGQALVPTKPTFLDERGTSGERLLANSPSESNNEIYIDRDIIVLANPEIAELPNWVIALVAAGGVAAALSTAAGLLLVISSAISHDLLKKTFMPKINDRQELFCARIAAAIAVFVAGLFGIYPPAFVAQVVAFAFGLAAASIFPALFLGIFVKSITREGAITGMLTGLLFTFCYIVFFKFIEPSQNTPENWMLGISPEGIGTIGMLLNMTIALTVSRFTPGPHENVVNLINELRLPPSESRNT
ncbi:MAG: hypothetical protein CBC09_09365 [Cellvibrionales bacterium TMED49]|nr:hypothetical protein [Porticoccaceae bacterium]OUU35185.1 MAG: hypothetical protein CBC09_09365 [Cellvibrionales bacterium TMED49]